MIVAWHGFMGSGEDFSPLRECLNVSLQAPDLVGHGSHLSTTVQDFELEQQLLYWSTRIPQGAVLLGYSMGGRLALQFALRYPDKISGLILIGATPGIRKESDRIQRVVWDNEQANRLLQQGMSQFYSYWQSIPIIQMYILRHIPTKNVTLLLIPPARLPGRQRVNKSMALFEPRGTTCPLLPKWT